LALIAILLPPYIEMTLFLSPRDGGCGDASLPIFGIAEISFLWRVDYAFVKISMCDEPEFWPYFALDRKFFLKFFLFFESFM